MSQRLSQRASASRRSARADVVRFARRMDRVETLARVFCILVGALLAGGAVMFFLCTVRFGPRAVTAAVLGAVFIGVAATVLLQRGLTGRDPDTESLSSLKLRRWY